MIAGRVLFSDPPIFSYRYRTRLRVGRQSCRLRFDNRRSPSRRCSPLVLSSDSRKLCVKLWIGRSPGSWLVLKSNGFRLEIPKVGTSPAFQLVQQLSAILKGGEHTSLENFRVSQRSPAWLSRALKQTCENVDSIHARSNIIGLPTRINHGLGGR